jgi:hypothetical protein
MKVCRGLHVLAAGKNMEPATRLVLMEQLHQLAATAATQWVTTELGHVAGAAFTSAVHSASDQSFMAAFAPQLEAAQVAHRANEALREARRQAVSPVPAQATVYCYACCQPGHKSTACPNFAPQAAPPAPSWPSNWPSSAPSVTLPAIPALE